jgi:hypothetical protein
MAVYVDNARLSYGRMVVCHMVADSMDELHAMARLIGVRVSWFHNGSTPHYDISLQRKAMAIAAGAIEVDRRRMVEVIRKIRECSSEGGDPLGSEEQLAFTFV